MNEIYRVDKRIAFCRLLETYRIAAKSINLSDIEKYIDAKHEIVGAYMNLVDEVERLKCMITTQMTSGCMTMIQDHPSMLNQGVNVDRDLNQNAMMMKIVE